MSIIFQTVSAYARFFGGDTGPAGLAEARYIKRNVPAGTTVVDVGGGEGKLARVLAADRRTVFVLDREETLRDGADNSIYEGSLSRLLRARGTLKVIPVLADATAFPLHDSSVDAVVSCQLLEHIDSRAKQKFFSEARAVQCRGVPAISTPTDMMKVRRFWISDTFRKLIGPDRIPRVPRSLRGPWLEHSIEEWETKVGHFGHGCSLEELNQCADDAGLAELDRRASHTRLTGFFLELMFTFPLAAMAAAPLVRLLYAVESRMPPMPGINLLMTKTYYCK
jgi:ubiquinone/menaquinone biosynthesis C-methylase UbiE